VTPVKLSTNPQVDKSTTPQTDKSTKLHGSNTIANYPQIHKTTKPQVEKYTTHLKRETIKRIKLFAVEHDIPDYEVVQTALENYFDRLK
jgi:uncharacterized Zn finger protein